jgi:hypothetical protein
MLSSEKFPASRPLAELSAVWLTLPETFAAYRCSRKFRNSTAGVASVLIHRGSMLEAMGRHAEALEDERRGLALFGGQAPSRYYIAGMVNTAAILLDFKQRYRNGEQVSTTPRGASRPSSGARTGTRSSTAAGCGR